MALSSVRVCVSAGEALPVDIFMRNTSSGDDVVWYMDGVNMMNWVALPANTDLNWTIVGVQ